MSAADVFFLLIAQTLVGGCLGALWTLRWAGKQADEIFAAWKESSDKTFEAWRIDIEKSSARTEAMLRGLSR